MAKIFLDVLEQHGGFTGTSYPCNRYQPVLPVDNHTKDSVEKRCPQLELWN
ncbi:MAG: hypothetical protein WCG61_03770 [Chlorobium sp.]